MHIRSAVRSDAEAMSLVLQQLVAADKRSSPSDLSFVLERYIDHTDIVQCSVAISKDKTVLGFQILKRAAKGNIYNVEVGWGIIGTHISPNASRRGIGKALFAETLNKARASRLKNIDASIGKYNVDGLAYYEAMGFSTYRTSDEVVCKRFQVP